MKQLFSFLKQHLVDAPLSVVRYVKARLSEPSTWIAISAGITSAAALSAPYSYAVIACAVIVAILPTGGKSAE